VRFSSEARLVFRWTERAVTEIGAGWNALQVSGTTALLDGVGGIAGDEDAQ